MYAYEDKDYWMICKFYTNIKRHADIVKDYTYVAIHTYRTYGDFILIREIYKQDYNAGCFIYSGTC